MGRRVGGARQGAGSAFRATLLAQRAAHWARWGTESSRVEHEEDDRQIRAGASVLLSSGQVFAVLHAMGEPRASVFAWGGDGYGREWILTEDDELTPADGAA